jgi:transposase-like protein
LKKVNEKSQATNKMVRITMEVKKEIVEMYEGGTRIRDLAAAYRMPRTTVSMIVKNKNDIKSANVAKQVKSITKQRSGKSLDRFLVNVEPGDPQPGPSREKRQKREN